MSDDDWQPRWAFLRGVAEAYYSDDKDREDAAFLKLMHRDSVESIAQLVVRHTKLFGIYDRLKKEYEQRGKLVDQLQTEKSQILAENHTLRIELRDARVLGEQLQRSRTVTK